MHTQIRLTFDKVRHDQSNEIHCVLSLKAPKQEWQRKRPPVCVVCAIDVSGSMCGDKMHFAKQSVLKLADHLQPGDWCGVVAFETHVHSVFVPQEMTPAQKEVLKSKVGSLTTMGCTNLSGGMLQALQWTTELETRIPEEMQVRVILFTDGQPNQGVATDAAGLSKLLKAQRRKASLSAFGYGMDADQDLLAELAKIGGGNYAFVCNPEDALTAFARELGGLLSTYATEIEVEVKPCSEHKILSVVTDVEAESQESGVKIKIPNIYSEEERHLVLKVSLSKQSKAFPRRMNIAAVSVSYQIISESGSLEQRSLTDKIKILYVKQGEEQTAPTPEVDKLVALAELARAQVEAEKQAKSGHYAAAVDCMKALSAIFVERGLVQYAAVANNLGDGMASQQNFADSSGYRNSSQRLATRAISIPTSCEQAEQDFASLGVSSLGNDMQQDIVRSFTENASPVAVLPILHAVIPVPPKTPPRIVSKSNKR